MTYTELRNRITDANPTTDEGRRLVTTARHCLFGMAHRTDFRGATEALDLLDAIS